MSVKWLKKEEKQAIWNWLDKKSQPTICPFFNLAKDKGLSQESFCWICEKAFPLIKRSIVTRGGCPCYVLSVKEVEKVAKKLIEEEEK